MRRGYSWRVLKFQKSFRQPAVVSEVQSPIIYILGDSFQPIGFAHSSFKIFFLSKMKQMENSHSHNNPTLTNAAKTCRTYSNCDRVHYVLLHYFFGVRMHVFKPLDFNKRAWKGHEKHMQMPMHKCEPCVS